MISPSMMPDETVFEEVGTTDPETAADEQETLYNATFWELADDARDHEESDLRPEREIAEQFYNGQLPGLSDDDVEDDEEGRSSVVSMAARDTIMAMMPSLIRIFSSPEHVVEFIPSSEQSAAKAEEQTDYISNLFWEQNEGFLLIHSVIKDALNKKMGIVKWWTDTVVTKKYAEYTNIPELQYRYVISQPGTEVIEEQGPIPPVEEGFEPTYNVKVQVTTKEPVTRIEAVPPEEFRINRYAKSVQKSRIIGHERNVPISDLVMLGFSAEDVKMWNGASSRIDNGMERIFRIPGGQDGANEDDWLNEVGYGEWWVEIDKDGDGINELRYIRTVGDKIISDDPASSKNMCIFTPDPEPHTAIGHSVNEQMQDLQVISTNVLRTTLDSMAATINPRIAVVENMVNMDDVLNDAVGAPIRMKAAGMVTPLPSMFIGDPALSMLDRLDALGQRRSGISEASKGLDPKALQSTTVKGVDMVITGAQERIELVARVLAETGMKDMFKGLLKEVTDNPNKKRTLKLRGKWVDVDPRTFDPELSVRVNPALGRGSDMDRFMILNTVKLTQEQIIAQAGMDNPMVSPNEYYNTLNDILSIAGIKNTSRYFKNPSPEETAAWSQKQAEKPDPNLMLAQAEVKKAGAQEEKIKADTIKTIAQTNQQQSEFQIDDDFRRDKLEAETKLKAFEIGTDAMGILAGIREDRSDELDTGPEA